MNVGPAKWSTVGAVLLGAIALVSTAPASADPNDDAFVAALAKAGIVFPERNAISIAHTVCAGFDKSDKTSIVAMKLMKDTDLSLRQSSYFVGASISAYCPQYIGRTDNSARWLLPAPPLM
jgi:hypothetical protein